MDSGEVLEVRLIGKNSVVLDVQCYFCVYVVHIVYSLIIPMVLSACCIYGFLFILHM